MENQIAVRSSSLESKASIEALRATAQMFSLSSFVKAQELKGGNPMAINNAMIIASMAQDFGLPVHYLFNQVYFVHGAPCFSSQFFIAQFNLCGKFSRIQYELSGKGEDYGCVASCIELATKEKLSGSRVTMKMAHESRWSPIWDKLPEQMLRYRSAVFLIRSVAPEVMFGLHTNDEEEDIATSSQPLTVKEEYFAMCRAENIDADAIVTFTLNKYEERGEKKSRDDIYNLYVKNPSYLKKAVETMNPRPTVEQKPTEQSEAIVVEASEVEEKISVGEMEARAKAGRRIVIWSTAVKDDPYSTESRWFAFFQKESGQFVFSEYQLVWNAQKQIWEHCGDTVCASLSMLIEKLSQREQWKLLPENTERPK